MAISLDGGQTLAITASLDSLLRQLRNMLGRACEQQPLWADAVCIKQEDAAEKETQVARMADIYRAARRVIVDLGEVSPDMDLALDLMEKWWWKHLWGGVKLPDGQPVKPRLAAKLMGLKMPDRQLRERFEGEELPGRDDPQWQAVGRFFDRPWFRRLWVVQEFLLARDVSLVCGERNVAYELLVGASLITQKGGVIPLGE